MEELLFRLESAGADREALEDKVFFNLNFGNKEPEAAPKTPQVMKKLEATAFSPSALNNYLACPLKFYFTNVLGLREQEEVSEEISRASIGNIVHRALELFFLRGNRLGRPFAPGEFKDELAALKVCLREALLEFHLTDTDRGYGYVMYRQIEKRLEDILHYHIEGLGAFTPLAVEAEFEAELELPLSGIVRLRGKADRIDLRQQAASYGQPAVSKIVIVDYKTGSMAKVPSWHGFTLETPRPEWSKTLRSVQLPVYVLLAMTGKVKLAGGAKDHVTPALKGLTVNDFDARLMMLGKQDITEESLYKPYSHKLPDVPSAFAKYKGAVCALLEEILDPDRPFEPTKREDDCKHCPFKVMCGRQWVKE